MATFTETNRTASTVAPLILPSDHVLILYNSTGSDSVALKDYYLANRRGITGANVLGLACPGTGESISDADYVTYIRTPIVAWLAAHPDNPIKYVVCLGYQFPRRISGGTITQSLAFRLSVCQQEAATGAAVNARYYTGSQNTRFFGPAYTPYISFLPAFIVAANLADEKAYIDKLGAFGDLYSPGQLIISPRAGGYGNTAYVFDDTRISPNFDAITFAPGDSAAVLAENASATVTTQLAATGTPIQSLANLSGYRGWGGNCGVAGWNGNNSGATFIYDGKLQGSGASNWYITNTIESYNGQVNGQGQLSWYGQWFAANALHGTGYQYTPAAMWCTTEEPTASGEASSVFYRFWERGYVVADCAYAALQTLINPYGMLVGDPFITR